MICLDLRQLVTRGGHENGMKNILDSDIALHAFGSNCSFVASFMSILMHSLLWMELVRQLVKEVV